MRLVVELLQDPSGRELALHYDRTKDGAEVDFAISEDRSLTQLIECKATDDRVHQ